MINIRKRLPILIVVVARGIHQLFSFGGCCRFEPTCSNYCAQSFEQHGVFKGAYLSFVRLIKCHPWGGGHGYDYLGREVG